MNKTAMIVEDHPVYRDALKFCLEKSLGEQGVVAVANTEEALVHANANQNLGLILLDLGLPGVNGMEALQLLCRASPQASIIVVSGSEDRRDMEASLRAGAKAFVSKAVTASVISDAAVKLLNGETLESTCIGVASTASIKPTPGMELTQRQRDTLTLLCEGLSNKEIGLRLGLSENTIKMHISAIFNALGVDNRTQAVLLARRYGLCLPT